MSSSAAFDIQVTQEILAMKQRVEEMEREANKLRELQAAAEKQENGSEAGGDGSVAMETEDERASADGKSIFVGNVSGLVSRPLKADSKPFLFRLTTQLHRKRFNNTSRHAALSTA